MDDIRASLERVRERVARAAERVGRRAEDVLLIGVSKTVEPARIREAIAAGVPALGENRVQEARAKIAELGRPVPWHLVGQLQTNKARDAAELFDLIHSVDRPELARELDKRARQRGRSVTALVQVNVARERSKGGVPPEELNGLLDAVAKLDHVRALGKLGARHDLRELSMGMSGDFEVAIEEGATMVRVGTAIFGPRPAGPQKEPREP